MNGLGILGRTNNHKMAMPLSQYDPSMPDIQWGVYSEKTKELQRAYNQILTQFGYQSIAVDGKLGPMTCGAGKVCQDQPGYGFIDIPAACTGHTWSYPKKVTTQVITDPQTQNPFPWGVYSPATVELQKALNSDLARLGYKTIAVDGKLGALTCGAARALRDRHQISVAVPTTCRIYTDPTQALVAATAPPPASALPRDEAPPAEIAVTAAMAPPTVPAIAPRKPGLSTASMLAIGGGLAAASIGVYYYGKKKGWFKG